MIEDFGHKTLDIGDKTALRLPLEVLMNINFTIDVSASQTSKKSLSLIHSDTSLNYQSNTSFSFSST
jgi:hypothetical protein